MDTKSKPDKKLSHATDTSNCDTSTDNRGKDLIGEKKPTQARITPWSDVTHNDVAVACEPFTFRPWVSVAPYVGFLRRKRFNLNEVLNHALLFYFNASDGGCDDVRDFARLALLAREEQQLIRLNKLMLRSGAYLDLYADKVLRGGEARLDAKLGRKPLRALAPGEEPVFKRMMARREAIVKEICEILNRRLPKGEYVLKGERGSRSRARDKTESTTKGGEDRNGDDS